MWYSRSLVTFRGHLLPPTSGSKSKISSKQIESLLHPKQTHFCHTTRRHIPEYYNFRDSLLNLTDTHSDIPRQAFRNHTTRTASTSTHISYRFFSCNESWNISVGTATRLRATWLRNRGSIHGSGNIFFLLFTTSRSAVGPTRTPIQWVQLLFTRG
jgi:hypothetical protein